MNKLIQRIVLGGALLAGLFFVFSPSSSEKKQALGPMSQEVYIWQRVWTNDVTTSVQERIGFFSHATLLVAEMNQVWSAEDTGQWSVEVFSDPLRYTQDHPVTLAVRIGAGASRSNWDPGAIAKVIHLLKPLSRQTQTFQIDYDCPSRKLDGYIKLCEAIKKNFPQHSLEITCLPDWLNQNDFPLLIKRVDRFIMQVHGVLGYGKTLCDPALARQTAQKCAHLGAPFLIALPTYRHVVLRNDKAQIIQVISEGGEIQTGKNYELMTARHGEIAALIRHWQKVRPASMEGVIWYRLPVRGDAMNWTWPSLQQVMRGEVPEQKWTTAIKESVDGSYVLTLTNATIANLEWPKQIDISWDSGFCVAADQGPGFELNQLSRQDGARCRWRSFDLRPVPPNTSVFVAWFRFLPSDSPTFQLKITEKSTSHDRNQLESRKDDYEE